MGGLFVAVVGPSGAGKDTLIDLARETTDRIVRRTVPFPGGEQELTDRTDVEVEETATGDTFESREARFQLEAFAERRDRALKSLDRIQRCGQETAMSHPTGLAFRCLLVACALLGSLALPAAGLSSPESIARPRVRRCGR